MKKNHVFYFKNESDYLSVSVERGERGFTITDVIVYDSAKAELWTYKNACFHILWTFREMRATLVDYESW